MVYLVNRVQTGMVRLANRVKTVKELRNRVQSGMVNLANRV